MRRLFLCGLLTATAHGTAALAQDAMCTDDLDDERIRGNLNVTSRCELRDTDVRGNVVLFAGGALIARGTRIRGNLEGDRANFVDLDRVRIDGNVELQELVGDSSRIERSDIRGNAVLAGNRSRLEILNNDLRGSLRVSGTSGGLLIAGNSIDGDLICTRNRPAPTGLGNRVDGDADAQCANLRPDGADTPPPDSPPPAAEPPPTPSRPPAASPPAPSPPATPAPVRPSTPPTPAPPATPPPAVTPPAATPPAASPPAAPPASTPPAAGPPAAMPPDEISLDDGGAGAIGWEMVFLLPLAACRRLRRWRSLRPRSAG